MLPKTVFAIAFAIVAAQAAVFGRAPADTVTLPVDPTSLPIEQKCEL